MGLAPHLWPVLKGVISFFGEPLAYQREDDHKLKARDAARAIAGLLGTAESIEQNLDGNCEVPDNDRLARLF